MSEPTPPRTARAPVWVVRHACAGHKDQWNGARDDDRPLDHAGVQQASALAAELAKSRPCRLLSSPTKRCVQTLEPLAALLGLPIEPSELLAKGHADDVGTLLHLDTSAAALFCTHGEVMEPLLEQLHREGVRVEDELSDEDLLHKGVAWTLTFDAQPRLRRIAPVEIHNCPLHPVEMRDPPKSRA